MSASAKSKDSLCNMALMTYEVAFPKGSTVDRDSSMSSQKNLLGSITHRNLGPLAQSKASRENNQRQMRS